MDISIKTAACIDIPIFTSCCKVDRHLEKLLLCCQRLITAVYLGTLSGLALHETSPYSIALAKAQRLMYLAREQDRFPQNSCAIIKRSLRHALSLHM